MPINRRFPTVHARRVRGSQFYLVINKVDDMLRLISSSSVLIELNYQGAKELRSDIIAKRPGANWPELRMNRSYLIRYNNNNGAKGVYDFYIYQKFPRSINGKKGEKLEEFKSYGIRGRLVREMPFKIMYEPRR